MKWWTDMKIPSMKIRSLNYLKMSGTEMSELDGTGNENETNQKDTHVIKWKYHENTIPKIPQNEWNQEVGIGWNWKWEWTNRKDTHGIKCPIVTNVHVWYRKVRNEKMSSQNRSTNVTRKCRAKNEALTKHRWSFRTPLLWCLYECSKLLLAVVLGPLVLGAWTGGPFALPCYGAWMNAASCCFLYCLDRWSLVLGPVVLLHSLAMVLGWT